MNGPRRDVEDNYPTYLEDELGYAWGIWDELSLSEIAAHDTIAHLDEVGLNQLDVAGLDDLERMAFVHASRRLGDSEGELAALRLIVNDPMEHPGVHYPEVFERLVDRLVDQQDFDEARHFYERLESGGWEWPRTTYVGALLTAREDKTRAAEAFSGLLAESPDDPELRYDIAEDLDLLGDRAGAERMLDDAIATAHRTGDDAVLVDIAVLRAAWAQASETESGVSAGDSAGDSAGESTE